MAENNEKILVILGDMFEIKGYVKVPVYNLVFNEILKLKKRGISVYLMTGNHDQYDAGGLVHALVPFKEIAKVYERLKLDVIEGITCVFVPYRKNKKQLAEELHKVMGMDLPTDSILFLHQILEGCQISDNYYAQREGLILPEGLKKKFKWIIAGDVHKPQHYENVWYCGSLFGRNFTDKFEQKSFLRYTGDTPEVIPNPKSPIFLKYIVKEQKDLDELQLEHTARIYIDVECSKEMLPIVHNLLDRKENIRYLAHRIKEKIEVVQRGNVKLAMGTEEIIRNYVDYAGIGDAKLKELGVSIYAEATKKL